MGGRDGAVGLREERLHFREHTEAKAMSVGAGEKKTRGLRVNVRGEEDQTARKGGADRIVQDLNTSVE